MSPVREMFSKPGLSVGIDISTECIRLVKTGSRFNKKPAIIDFRSLPLTPGIVEDRDRMTDLLRSHLADFCPAPNQASIWVSAPQEGTDVRRLRVPKVSVDKLENVVYWTYQKEAPFEKDRTILDFRILGDIIDNGVAKTEVLVCTTPSEGVLNLKAIFNAAGYALTGVMAPPFALQNYFKAGWLEKREALSCSLLIDFNWSRIDIFRAGGDLLVSRGIKAGIASMIESIRSGAARTPGNISAPNSDDGGLVLDLPAFDIEKADQALKLLSSQAGTSSFANTKLLREDDVFIMVLPALERLIRQVERTLEHVSLRFSDGPIESMLMSGPITAYPRLVDHLAHQLNLSHASIDPFASTSDGLAPPKEASNRATYVSAVGLSLSSTEYTPNFLLTHREAGMKRRGTRLNQAVLILFILGLAGMWAAHHMINGQLVDLETKVQHLVPVAAMGTGEDDRAALLALADTKNNQQQALKAYAAKNLPVAMIGEITNLAPEHIRFVRLEGHKPAATNASLEKDTAIGTALLVDAVVFGTSRNIETRLAEYLLVLKQSPIFSRVLLKEKTFGRQDTRDILRFTLELEGV